MTRAQLFILPIKSEHDIRPGDYEIDTGAHPDPELAQYPAEMAAWRVFRRALDRDLYRVRRTTAVKVA